MKFKSVKKVSELVLDGITFQMEKLDSQLSSVTLTDKSGHVVRFAKHGYLDFGVFTPEVEKEKKFELSYELELQGQRTEYFDNKYEADSRLSMLQASYGSMVSNSKIAEVEIEVTE